MTKTDGVPEFATERLAICRDASVELEHLWASPSSGPLWWDFKRNVWVRSRYHGTYRGLYGTWAAFRGVSGLRSGLRKVKKYMPPGRWSSKQMAAIPLPADAVVLHAHEGVVIASREQQHVLKIVRGTVGSRALAREIAVQNALKEANIQHFVPTVVDSGTTDTGYDWMLSEFAPNTNPLKAPLRPMQDPRQRWRDWLQAHVLPDVLEPWYELQGVEHLNTDDVLEEQVTALQHHPQAAILQPLLARIEAMRPSEGKQIFIQTMLHGDLRIEHIHRSRDRWWLIDWGMAERGPLFWEFFPWQRRHATARYDNIQTFWAWLRGDTRAAELSANVQKLLQVFLNWQAEWMGLKPSLESLRYQLLVSLLKEIAANTSALDTGEPLAYNWEHRDKYSFDTLMAIKQLVGLHLIENQTPEELYQR